MIKYLYIFLIVLTISILYSQENKMSGTIYNYSAKSIDGKEINLGDYKGKVVLIVNVASKCGFTKQYKGLEELYEKFKGKGLVILGFPCNQFGSQEPGTEDEIKTFCSTNYGVSFPMFAKIDVNGENAHPLYKFLTKEKSGLITDSIKWNFTKFLVDKDGKVVDRFAPTTTPESLAEKIEEILNK
jgi:glutathione peroxidase